MEEIEKWAQEVWKQAAEDGKKQGYTIPQMRAALRKAISEQPNKNQIPETTGQQSTNPNEMTVYVDKAYKTLVNSGVSITKKELMETALRIMYVIHKQEKKDFEGFLSGCTEVCCNKNSKTIRAKVVGKNMDKLYAGIRKIIQIYLNAWWNPPLIGIGSSNEPSRMWSNVKDSIRYEYLIAIEKRLAEDMEKI